MDREWLYPGVPVEVGRGNNTHYRFWRLLQDGFTAWCIEYPKGYARPRLAVFNVYHLRISERPSNPPPMPNWARED